MTTIGSGDFQRIPDAQQKKLPEQPSRNEGTMQKTQQTWVSGGFTKPSRKQADILSANLANRGANSVKQSDDFARELAVSVRGKIGRMSEEDMPNKPDNVVGEPEVPVQGQIDRSSQEDKSKQKRVETFCQKIHNLRGENRKLQSGGVAVRSRWGLASRTGASKNAKNEAMAAFSELKDLLNECKGDDEVSRTCRKNLLEALDTLSGSVWFQGVLKKNPDFKVRFDQKYKTIAKEHAMQHLAILQADWNACQGDSEKEKACKEGLRDLVASKWFHTAMTDDNGIRDTLSNCARAIAENSVAKHYKEYPKEVQDKVTEMMTKVLTEGDTYIKSQEDKSERVSLADGKKSSRFQLEEQGYKIKVRQVGKEVAITVRDPIGLGKDKTAFKLKEFSVFGGSLPAEPYAYIKIRKGDLWEDQLRHLESVRNEIDMNAVLQKNGVPNVARIRRPVETKTLDKLTPEEADSFPIPKDIKFDPEDVRRGYEMDLYASDASAFKTPPANAAEEADRLQVLIDLLDFLILDDPLFCA